MTILEVSPAALARLLLASLLHGAAVMLLYCVLCAVLSLRRLWRLDKIPRPAECAAAVGYKTANTWTGKIITALGDVFLTLMSACLLLVVNFIFNNGVFRLFTIPASYLGFVASHALFGNLTRMILTYIILCMKKTMTFILAPLRKLAAVVRNIIKKIIDHILRKLRIMRVKRYTKIQFGKISAAQRDGMPP